MDAFEILQRIQEEEEMLIEKAKEVKEKKLLKVLQKGEASELRTNSLERN